MTLLGLTTVEAVVSALNALRNHHSRPSATTRPIRRSLCFRNSRRIFRPKRRRSCLIAVDNTDLSRPEDVKPPDVTGSMDKTQDHAAMPLQFQETR